MKGYIAVTDYAWYTFLRDQRDLKEVNFWQPSSSRKFGAVPPGAPFFFKLHSPHNAIAGFGFFEKYSSFPAWYTWDTFGHMNGAADFETMLERIEKYRPREKRDPHGQYEIGCLIILKPVFFEEDDWIKQPRDWKSNIVQGTTYGLTSGEGRRIWEECLQRAAAQKDTSLTKPIGAEDEPKYGKPILVRPRLGQGTFRIEVTDAYRRCCAVTAERALPVLDAAHIKPYALGGEHSMRNGLLLRTDIHKLFDMGYVTVTPQYRFEASRKLKDDFGNGEIYREFHGNAIHLPKLVAERPDPVLLRWHNEKVFRS